MAKKVTTTSVGAWLSNNKNTIVAGAVGIAACIIMMVQCGRISDLEQGQSELIDGQQDIKTEVVAAKDLVEEGNEVNSETNEIVNGISTDVAAVKADVDTVKTVVQNCCGAKKTAVKPAKKPAAQPAKKTTVKPAAEIVVVKDTVIVADSSKVSVEIADSSKNNGNIVVDAKELQSAQVVIENGSVNNGNIIIGDNNVVIVNEPVQQKMDTLTIIKKHTRTVEYVFTGVKKRRYR